MHRNVVDARFAVQWRADLRDRDAPNVARTERRYSPDHATLG
jgi:hypothetical protein